MLNKSAFSLCFLGLAVLTACSATQAVDRAGADIGNLSEGGVQVQSLKTPVGYKQGDKLIAYEGPGWESDLVAYRLYLDGRNALDIFGKRKADLVLSNVGRGEDYHVMADWGMDILKVGNSLGAGGFGIYKEGEVVQIGEAERYEASILSDTTDLASIEVMHEASQACNGDVKARYTIEAGTRLTDIRVGGDCDYPYAAGLIIHPGTVEIQSSGDSEWAYLARYGEQSLVPDNLGLALFYRPADVDVVGRDIDDSYIVFNTETEPHYLTGAAWIQEPNGLQNEADFRTWLDATRQTLNEK